MKITREVVQTQSAESVNQYIMMNERTIHQEDRYKSILQFAGHESFEWKGILDIGCGHTFFRTFLLEKGINLKNYIGIDLCLPIVNKARDLFPGVKVYQALWPFIEKYQRNMLLSYNLDLAIFINWIHYFDAEIGFELIQSAFDFVKEKVIAEWTRSIPQSKGLIDLCRQAFSVDICDDGHVIILKRKEEIKNGIDSG